MRDLQTGQIVRASQSETEGQADGDSTNLAISADGHLVAFVTLAPNLVSNDANDDYDVLVKDLQTGKIVRASESASGGGGNAASGVTGVAISADGRYVAFDSDATNLIPDDTNGAADIFVKDLQTGSIQRASETSTGGQADSDSSHPSLSPDGHHVGFISSSGKFVSGDDNGATDVFVKDLDTGELVRVSENEAGESGDAASGISGVSLTAEGRYAAFTSYAGNLLDPSSDNRSQIFIKDVKTRKVLLISKSPEGERGSGSSGRGGVSITPDGRFIAFDSSASNLIPEDTNGKADVFIADTGLEGDIPFIPGDLNGDGIVAVGDALLALQAAVGQLTLTASQQQTADTNGDGKVTLGDVISILRSALQLG